MLATIKKLMKSWFAAGILGLLVVCMAFLGLGTDPFGRIGAGMGNWVIKAGSTTVGPAEFRAIFDRMKKGAEQQGRKQRRHA